ncbi:cytochrome c3 family protein [Ramlibacter sp. AN1133]|uniref:cytochrome c3 family protein n=1 Tax=Ramlibacter sp. AN1133 TaxID=3133429 RepID=UPI0030BA840D
MKFNAGWLLGGLVAVLLSTAWVTAGADTDIPTKFSNRGSIANTRHNMTQRQAEGGGPAATNMDPYRNDYQEVCVYCHTPHGANSNVALPLWNRTIKATTYQTYNQLGTASLTQPVTQPGPNSLACLSCHDGQVGVDSVINMPGSGGYNANQATTQSDTFLNAWNNSRGPDATRHMGLNQTGCLACHSAGALLGGNATDFAVFVIGTDLRNDHPVGVRFPTAGPGVDFKPPTATRVGMAWFDDNSNRRPDTNEVRLYDSGEGFEVECASCHDPHGVPSNGVGSQFNPTFLRVTNAGSALCLTCHSK